MLTLQEARPGEPESAMLAGMAAPATREVQATPFLIPDTSAGAVSVQQPAHWSYDLDPASGQSRASFPGIMNANGANNVFAYQADPSGNSDSSGAINRAAARIGSNGHRMPVYLSTGTYRVDRQIILTDGQTLFGDGEGSSYLVIYDNFDPSAASIILCTSSTIDPGPTIRDLGIWFIQPNDLSTRATMKTLAAGGTGFTPGGSGVQYPWAIATSGNCGRIQVQRVIVLGAWNGINADAACFWINGLKMAAFNIGIAIGGTMTLRSPVLDWALLSMIEFYPWGMWPGQKNIFMDGQTIAMRIGAQNGLLAQNIACLTSRLIFTADAQAGWIQSTNSSMDAGQSTIEVAAAFFLQLTNLYYTCGTNAVRAGITVANCQTMLISNLYAHTSSPFALLSASGGDVTLTGATMLAYDTTHEVIRVQGGGTLRINGARVLPGGNVAWTAPVIHQTDTGALQVDNLDVRGGAGTSGTAVRFDTHNTANSLGSVILSTGWTNVPPP